MNKIGVGLTFNAIIVAIMVLIVLFVLIMVFTGYFGTFGPTLLQASERSCERPQYYTADEFNGCRENDNRVHGRFENLAQGDICCKDSRVQVPSTPTNKNLPETDPTEKDPPKELSQDEKCVAGGGQCMTNDQCNELDLSKFGRLGFCEKGVEKGVEFTRPCCGPEDLPDI